MNMDPVYRDLAARIGFGDSAFIPRIIAKVANVEEAHLLAALPCNSNDELAAKLGMDKTRVDRQVQELFEKGLIFKRIKGGYRTFYSVTELKDSTPSNPKFDKVYGEEFFDLWDGWFSSEEAAKWWFNKPDQPGQIHPLMRIAPKWKAIKDIPGVLPCDDVREMFRANEDTLGINHCSCRRVSRRHALKEIPEEICFVQGKTAEYCFERGSGHRISLQEAMAILEKTEKLPLVHILYNSKPMTRLVGQCGGYCIVFRWSDPGTINDCAPSRFQAMVDPANCVGCGECVKVCLFKAAQMKPYPGLDGKNRAFIDTSRCTGCGNCVVACCIGARRMNLVRPPSFIPDNYTGIY
jgi:ferredoxin/biotin operon repressor